MESLNTLTESPYETDLLPKVVKALCAGTSTRAVHKNLTTKYEYDDTRALALIAEAETEVTATRRRDLKERLALKRRELKENDDGVSPDAVKSLEDQIKSLLDPEDLEAFNDDLAAKGRRLTFTDIAFVAAVHRQSIKENRGDSPFKRFVRLSAKGLIAKPLDHRQIRYALSILETLGCTRQVGASKRGGFGADGKFRKGQCCTWEWLWGN
jgi:hypothetical protein